MREIVKSKWSLGGVALALALIALGVIFRPYWRDEYWALYFSARELSLYEAVTQRMVRDVHPPLYFILQHYWRMPFESELWARALNVLTLALGAGGIWALGRRRREETLLFLILCAGSYWVIFYTIELRMYLLLFALCALSGALMRNALDMPTRAGKEAALFAVIGALAGVTQFFGALWIAVASFWTGLALLRGGSLRGFLAWGVAGAAAILPAALWIALVHPESNPGAQSPVIPFADQLGYALVQFGRSVLIKTLGSNLAAAAVLLAMTSALLRRRDPFDLVLVLSFWSAAAIAFLLHLFAVPLIKERAFIALMPAVIYLFVRAVDMASAEARLVRLRAAIPLFILISPLFFIGEYAKDREHWGEVRALLKANALACAGAAVVAYNRPSAQAADFAAYLTRMALRGAADGRDVLLLDADALIASGHAAPPSACPVRAVALSLPKGETVLHAEARAKLSAAGVPLQSLKEESFGRGRTLVFTDLQQ
jgi:hypothetical protein